MPDPDHGVLVSDATFRRDFNSRSRQALAVRAQIVGSDARTIARVTRSVVGHDHSRRVAREIAYIPGGAWVVWKHWREGHTNARYDRLIRAAEAQSDWENLREWEARAELARDRRHKRAMDYLRAPKELVKSLAVLTLLLVVSLLLLGFAGWCFTGGTISVIGPIKAVMYAIAWTVWFVAIAGPVLLAAVVALVVGTLWWVGRHQATVPKWLESSDVIDASIERISSDRVILALSKLGITELTKAIRDAGDGAGMMLSHITSVGCGAQVDIALPGGVATKTLIERRHLFAENLGRHRHEVFLEIAPKVRPEVRAWIANSGALDEPVGPSPLVTDPRTKASYQLGRAPWGLDVRGDSVGLSLYQCHVLITGSSNQGKSRCLIALALWLALDPSVAFWIADLKGIDRDTKKSDWEPLRKVADRFVSGPADEHVVAATEMVEAAEAEMKRRIMEGGAWEPLVVVIDEAQRAYLSPAISPDGRPYGGQKHTSRFFMAVKNIQDQGRVVDVLVWQGTQNPTDKNLPKLIREGAHIRGSLAVGSEAVAKMAMGDEAFLGGAAPHQLRKGIDRGTVVVTGDGVKLAPGQSSVTVRTHYIDSRAAAEIAKRALGRRVDRVPPDIEAARDLLEDVLAVMDNELLVRATSVADRLRERIAHRRYASLNGARLMKLLAAEGVVVAKLDGTHTVRDVQIRKALDDRKRGDT